MQNLLFLLIPIILVIIVVFTRFFLLWVERRNISKHAKRIYLGALNYISGNESKQDLEILATRQAFYEAVVVEQKIYKPILRKLQTLLQTKDQRLLKSFSYLDPKSEE